MNTATNLYLDECIDLGVGTLLLARGYSVSSAAAAGMLRATDDEQLRYAAGSGLVILTHNRRDFRRLHREWLQQGKAHAGILIMPFAEPLRSAVRTAMLLDWLLASGDPAARIATWGKLQFQITQGLRLDGF